MSKLKLCAATLALALAIPATVSAAPAPRNYAGVVPQGSNFLMVFANPVPGKETEFAAWYEKHMRDMIKLPGFVRIQRFQAAMREGRPDPAFGFLVLYEYSGDPNIQHQRIQEAVKQGRVESPDPRYVAKYDSMVYRAISPGVTPP
jgi:hypothetical protein